MVWPAKVKDIFTFKCGPIPLCGSYFPAWIHLKVTLFWLISLHREVKIVMDILSGGVFYFLFLFLHILIQRFFSYISMPVKYTLCMYSWLWLGKLASRSPFVAGRLESCTVDTLALFFTSVITGWLQKCKSQELLKLFQKFIWFGDAGDPKGRCQAYARLMRSWSS